MDDHATTTQRADATKNRSHLIDVARAALLESPDTSLNSIAKQAGAEDGPARDAVAVQGPGAGGHRGTLDPAASPATQPLGQLVRSTSIALDVPGNRMFVTDFAGSVYSADLDGKNERNFLYGQGNLTGIAYTSI